jgi:hypothetical protein
MKKLCCLGLLLLLLAGCGEQVSNEVDVDLTTLSSTMVYGEVYNITTTPEEYLGKRIRMKGVYSDSYYDVTDQYYHYVVIQDATACCAQGLEFICKGNPEYPPTGEDIEVTGIFQSYEELGITYYCIMAEEVV